MQSQRIEMLQRMPIFGAISPPALEFLLAQTRQREVRAHDFFFRQGEQACFMYVLETGEVAVRKRWHNREFKLRTLGPGDCFGEMALMDLAERSASVRAETDCVAIELSSADLLRLYEHDVEQFALVQMNIGREVCRRLRATDELLFQAMVGEVQLGAETVFQSF